MGAIAFWYHGEITAVHLLCSHRVLHTTFIMHDSPLGANNTSSSLPSACPRLLVPVVPVVPQIPIFPSVCGPSFGTLLDTAFPPCHGLNLVVSYCIHLFHFPQRSFGTNPLEPSSQHGYEWDEWDEWDGQYGHG